MFPQSKAKLPTNREQISNSCFTVEEPENVSPGRYTLTQIIECIADHNSNKEMYTAQVLADRLQIDIKLMGVYL